MSSRSLLACSLGLGLMLAVACTGGDALPEAIFPPPATAPWVAGVIESHDCGVGLCAAGYRLNGRFYTLECEQVRADSVGPIFGTDGPAEFSEARELVGVAETSMLAVRSPQCDVDGWVASISLDDWGEPEASAIARASCDVYLAPAEWARCDRGGSASWSDDGVIRFGYFDDFVAELEGGGPGVDKVTRQQRLQPSGAISADIDRELSPGCAADVSCVILAGEPVVDGDLATVEVVRLEHLPENLGGRQRRDYEVTVERLVPGGDTWWLTALEYGDGRVGLSEDEWRAAIDCCPDVVFEPDPGTEAFPTTVPEP